MEKSLLSFATTYPGWEPGAAAKQMLSGLRPAAAGAAEGGRAPGAAAAGRGWPAGPPAGPHYPFTAHLGHGDRPGVLKIIVDYFNLSFFLNLRPVVQAGIAHRPQPQKYPLAAIMQD